MNLKHIYIALLYLFISVAGEAQISTCYHVDRYNGLSTNHVYRTLVDRYGYLWIATDNGVLQYNGYVFKRYDLSDGLFNNDVWDLFEDRKGRIWLESIGNGIGYVYNNKFKKITLKDDIGLIYPRSMMNYKGGVVFFNMYGRKNTSNIKSDKLPFNTMCLEHDDTINSFNVFKWIRQITPVYFTNQDNIVSVAHDGISKLHLDDIVSGENVKAKLLCTYDNGFDLQQVMRKENGSYLLDNKIISYKENGDYLRVYNVDGCKQIILKLADLIHRNEKALRVYALGSSLYIITANSINILDSKLALVKSYDIKELAGSKNIDGNYFSFFEKDKQWGKCLSTSSDGLFINFRSSQKFIKKTGYDLRGYKFIGNISDTVGYWWNNEKKEMFRIDNNGLAKHYHIRSLYKANKVIRYDDTISLLFTKWQIYWMNNNTGQVACIFDNINHYSQDFGDFSLNVLKTISMPVLDGVSYTHDSLYLVTPVPGFILYKVYKDSLYCMGLDFNNRYKHLVYDSLQKALWVYNNSEVLFYTISGRSYKIKNDVLEKAGIKHIEKMIVDRYQDIIVKDYDKIYLFNYKERVFRQLLSNYNLKGAKIFLHQGKLVIIGKFGIVFMQIDGANKISDPIAYPNIKSIYYQYVYDAQVLYDKIILSTDNGTYSISIPRDLKKDNVNATHHFHFIFILCRYFEGNQIR